MNNLLSALLLFFTLNAFSQVTIDTPAPDTDIRQFRIGFELETERLRYMQGNCPEFFFLSDRHRVTFISCQYTLEKVSDRYTRVNLYGSYEYEVDLIGFQAIICISSTYITDAGYQEIFNSFIHFDSDIGYGNNDFVIGIGRLSLDDYYPYVRYGYSDGLLLTTVSKSPNDWADDFIVQASNWTRIPKAK